MARPTLADIEATRSRSTALATGPVAYEPSASFKTLRQNHKSISLNHHFSAESKDFHGSALKKTAAKNTTQFIPLGTGRPAAEFYPWQNDIYTNVFSARMREHNHADNGEKNGNNTKPPGYQLATALNYGHAAGAPHLVRYLTEHVEMIHNPPYENWAVCLSCGSTSAFETALRIFCDRGDFILAEKYTYPGFVETARLLDLQVQSVDMDVEGLRADHLEAILRDWDVSRGARPRVLYTIPTGQNPTGATQSIARRQDIYKVAERYDLVIIEDDPYFFLQLKSLGPSLARDPNTVNEDPMEGDYVKSLLPSYLSLDTSGRVVRLDSTSKILAPGLRAGWVTGSDEVIEKFLSYHELTTVSVSGVSQLVLYELLEESWGHAGFLSWLEDLSLRYSRRLDIILAACKSYLPAKYCEYTAPLHGMFIWIRLKVENHPLFHQILKYQEHEHQHQLSIPDIENMILDAAYRNGVQVTKGSLFESSADIKPELHFRLTFVACQEADLTEGVRRFGLALEEEFRKVEIFVAKMQEGEGVQNQTALPMITNGAQI